MWVAGILLLFVTSSAVLSVYSWRAPPKRLLPPLWDIPSVAAAYTELCGSLAALSLAAAVFIATIAPGTANFEDAIGFFVIAFLILVAAAMQFGATPNSRGEVLPEFNTAQSISHVTAASSFYLGVGMSWLGLKLLLLALELDTAAGILTWMLLITILAGGLRIAANLYRHTDASGAVCILVVILAVTGAAFYKLALVAVWDDLWPEANEALWLATVAFGTAVAGYIYQTLVLAAYGEPRFEPGFSRLCQPLLTLYSMNVIQIVALVWFAVSEGA
jgi:hypothetical protein